MLKNKFEFIKETDDPKIIRHLDPSQSWKCTKLCSQGKTTFEDTSIHPMVETRHGQVTAYGEYMTKCEQTKYAIEKKGIDWVTANMMSPDHAIGKYKAPGEV